MYETLTQYIALLGKSEYGEWGPKEQKGDGSKENPYQMPFVIYDEVVEQLINDIYAFVDEHPKLELNNYNDILNRNGIEWGITSMEEYDVTQANGQCVMALLVGAVRAERFCDGALLDMLKSKAIQRWLIRLKELDEES